MKKVILYLSLIIFTFTSCFNSRIISGVITEIKSDTVTVDKVYRFKVPKDSSVWIGKHVSFTPTVVRSKINSKKVN